MTESVDPASPNSATQEDIETEEGVPTSFGPRLQRFAYTSTSNEVDNHLTSLRRSVRKRSFEDSVHDAGPGASQLSASPSPSKRRRPSSRYAPPSKYAHLPPLLDVLEPNLICIFVGTNPGIRTATAGHAYAHPSNLFWKLLHSSGCTDVRLPPSHDVHLPKHYCMGNTNIVDRPSRDAAELSKQETAAGTPILEDKVRRYRPEAVCIVGKGIWEAIWRWRYKRELKKHEFRYGWQDASENMGKATGEDHDDDEVPWKGARVFVASSTSGLSASLRPHEKEAIWKPFGEWVKARRKARFGIEGRLDGAAGPDSDD